MIDIVLILFGSFLLGVGAFMLIDIWMTREVMRPFRKPMTDAAVDALPKHGSLVDAARRAGAKLRPED